MLPAPNWTPLGSAAWVVWAEQVGGSWFLIKCDLKRGYAYCAGPTRDSQILQTKQYWEEIIEGASEHWSEILPTNGQVHWTPGPSWLTGRSDLPNGFMTMEAALVLACRNNVMRSKL